ncbi:hypothetical protein [Dubosiella newyorkensis]|nr:hypothetical protein [Dubosiella newyorkensis]
MDLDKRIRALELEVQELGKEISSMRKTNTLQSVALLVIAVDLLIRAFK